MKLKTLLTAALIALPFGAMGGCVAYDRGETTLRYKTGTDWNGDSAVWEYEDGRLFRSDRGKLIGYYGGGKPRLVAFGCEGRAADAILIAIEESDLPRCARIEPIANAPSVYWAESN